MASICEGGGFDYNRKKTRSTPTKTPEQIHLANMEQAYRVLKHIAEGGGSNPRIYAQNTIDSIKRNGY